MFSDKVSSINQSTQVELAIHDGDLEIVRASTTLYACAQSIPFDVCRSHLCASSIHQLSSHMLGRLHI